MAGAFLYLRVSGLNQVDGYGFDRQERTCKSYCRQHGLTVAGIFKEEGVSGALDETARPAFQEMVAAILTNGVRTVVVESMDRLARELRIQDALIAYLAAKDIDLYSARTGENITEAVKADPLRKALVQIQGVFAELEKSQLVRRLAKGREAKRKEHGRCEGIAPYGATDEEKALVRRMRAWHRRGRNGAPGLSYSEIARKLNGEETLTRYGNQWYPASVQRVIERRAR